MVMKPDGRPRFFIVLLAAWVAGLFVVQVVSASVGLVKFEATVVGGNSIKIIWVTASEFETSAFRLQRAVNAGGSWSTINEQPAQSDFGASYEYLDTDVEPVVVYQYRLIDVDISGTETAHDPISISLNGPVSTATATATTTGTQGPTRTPTQTRTPPHTRTPTAPPTPSPTDPPTATRQYTNTPEPTPTSPPTDVIPTPVLTSTETPLPPARVTTPETGGAGVSPLAQPTIAPTVRQFQATITSSALPGQQVTATRAPTLTPTVPTRTPGPTFTPSMTPKPAVFVPIATPDAARPKEATRTASAGSLAPPAPVFLWLGGAALGLAVIISAVVTLVWRLRHP
jgi:hypothetical protein